MKGASRVADAALVVAIAAAMLLAGAASRGGLAEAGTAAAGTADGWTDPELATLRSMSLSSLGEVPDDPSNAWDGDPRAADLGRALFFDPRLSANGAVSCAGCHRPELGFQDGRPRAEGIGRLPRRSQHLLGVAWNTWWFWDGRKDSLWAQALAPLVHPDEHGLTRVGVVEKVREHHRGAFESLFGPLPEASDTRGVTRAFVNTGKAIAAFVRGIRPGVSRFDRYVDAVVAGRVPSKDGRLTEAEERGLRLFVGRAKCVNCHAGPLLTNGDFHFSRVPQPDGVPDGGRGAAMKDLLDDEFACTGEWSDAKPEDCKARRFLVADARELMHAFKVPSLRGVAARPPYMHAGQFGTLAEALRFYRDEAEGMRETGHGDLTDAELDDLAAFLGTLDAAATVAAGGAEVRGAGFAHRTE